MIKFVNISKTLISVLINLLHLKSINLKMQGFTLLAQFTQDQDFTAGIQDYGFQSPQLEYIDIERVDDGQDEASQTNDLLEKYGLPPTDEKTSPQDDLQ